MARKPIDIGIIGNDGTGDSIRDAFRKVNDNFRELYGALGLGTKLSFLSLDETPSTFEGQENSVLAVNTLETEMVFKQITGGAGIAIDYDSNQNEIQIINTVASVSADTNPRLGGNLSAQSGAQQYRIVDLTTPISGSEAVNKNYADTKVALGGINAVDPATGEPNGVFGRMTGPLILSRDPQPEDDVENNGLVAATKRYVDNAGFGSVANLYVATSGDDARIGVGASLQGRALSYAFRTIEAALKRAEEIINEAPDEIGPYRKVLTWTDRTDVNNPVINNCILTDIVESPESGSGFDGDVLMTIDTIVINASGFNYEVGDILRIPHPAGTREEGVTQAASLEVLSVGSLPGTTRGPILTFRLLTGGVYLELPGSTNVATAGVAGTPVADVTDFGEQATFDISYEVNNVRINSGGSGYSLVSVRVTPVPGDTGTGAFGFADVTPVTGVINAVTITDGGSNFRVLPTLDVNLPRFRIYTAGRRTDFTGDVTTDTSAAKRGRDIREGLYLAGETSGALAQILGHSGELDSEGNELFDVDIKYGAFLSGELISYGDVANQKQICIFVEAGIYLENLPLKVPQNCAINGDEFRRTIIRPKPGTSSSPWAFQYFRRDVLVDGNQTGTNSYNRALAEPYGYHYLHEADKPVYTDPDTNLPINNRGFYRAASQLLKLNKEFIQEEVIAWIDYQIEEEISPFTSSFTYDSDIYKRDFGIIIDAMAYDLLYGGSARTISAALKYRDATNESAVIAIGAQLNQTRAAIERINTVAQLVIRNRPVFQYSDFLQIIDLAFQVESGAGGTPVSVSGISNSIIATVTTASAHGLSNGETVNFSNIGGMTEVNGNSYYITVLNSTQFTLFLDSARTEALDTRFYGAYTTGGTVTPNGGVINKLTEAILNIISDSNIVNFPEENDKLDVLLMNDATILRALTIQGAGGFALVLDPEGQILAKSPYAQEGAVFSKSTGRKTFAGGMYVDGFTGNLKFKIVSKDSNTRLRISSLQRFPQLPASYIVEDTVYRINYVRDYVFDPAGSTALLVLDETTPWPFPVFTYNEAACRRDVDLILAGVGYDVAFGSNYHARKAGKSYRLANAEVVISDQSNLTISAIELAHDLASAYVAALTPANLYVTPLALIASSKNIITNIIRRGITATPTLVLPNPPGLDTDTANGKVNLLANMEYIVEQATLYLAATYSPLTYELAVLQRDIRTIVEAAAYDLIYGGNSQSVDAGLKFYDGTFNTITQQFPEDDRSEIIDVISWAKTVALAVVRNTAPGTEYTVGQTVFRATGTDCGATVAGEISDLFTIVTDILTADTGVYSGSTTLPNLGDYSYTAANLTTRTTINTNATTIKESVIDYIDENANVYEILMPGNRSMLSNDFTQICDMGYGLVVNNGGLTEAVSMFTYYCYTSYLSLGGGQIRSVGGSSAHGVYALVAEGSDPLEVPTPVDAYYNFSQGAVVYNDGAVYNNSLNGFILYVSEYEYPPLDFSEVEIDHGGSIGLVRYPISAATTEEGFPDVSGKGIYRLNLTSDTTGLFAVVPDGTAVTLRINTQLVLTGDVVGVATRPSTALVLQEGVIDGRIQKLYRVLQFEDYEVPPEALQTVTIATGSETIFTTASPHGQLPDYIVKFSVSTGGSLPSGIIAGDPYYIIDDGFSSTSFKISTSKNGLPLATTTAGSGTFFFEPAALARTSLREGYDYVEATVWTRGPFQDYGGTILIPATELEVGVFYTIIFVGSSNFTSAGAGANTIGTSFTATGTTTGTGYAIVTDSLISSVDFGTKTAGSFVTGQAYQIVSAGTTDFTLIGAVNSTPGTVFTATGPGTGTGTARTGLINKTAHGFSDGDVIRFESSGDQPGVVGDFPDNLFGTRTYFVRNAQTDSFQLAENPALDTLVFFTSDFTGYLGVGAVKGIVGDTTIAINEVGTVDVERIVGMRFNFKGANYEILQYESPTITGFDWARITITPALEDSVVAFASAITLKCAVAARTEGSQGTLTIRISLTRVTSHDLLEIGTGSYADTNYPNEIYGPPVRIATETLLDTSGEQEYSQMVERGEGRCFFVTTDQFGNFSVGPFFRVDQGTGRVTFSAAIALSNLDGIGFKRGVPIAEFSTDSSFSDNATDTVPTENATREYLDRRLGVSHEGFTLAQERLIPPETGGFMALSGQLSMKGDLDMGSQGSTQNKITNLADPVDPTDAVNLRSIRIANIQDFAFSDVRAGDIFTFTGSGTESLPTKIDGDLFVPDDGLTTGLDSTLNQLNVYIKPGIIDNANINASAAIAQSKLNLQSANTFDEDSATSGWSGTDPKTQADLGLAKFSDENFETTSGYVRIKANGIALGEIAQVATDTVIGRSAAGTGDVSAVPFATVVDEGFAIKKNQYATTGFLRRTGATNTLDADYGVIDATDTYTGVSDGGSNSKLVIRSASGDFGGRNVSASVAFNVGVRKITDLSTTATGGSINLYGFGNSTSGSLVQAAGIAIADGSLTTDRVTTYRNDNHLFRNRANTTNAPIVVSQITAGTFTTGGASTTGNLTGNFFLTTTSNLTLGTGTLDTQTGTLLSRTLTTGDVTTTGVITGDWSLASTSNLTLGTGTLDVRTGTFLSDTLDAGTNISTGTIEGNWSLTSGSKIDATLGTLQSTTLTSGAVGTAGVITGNWSMASTSNLTLGTGYIDARTGTLYSDTLTTGASGTAGVLTGNWALSASSQIDATAGTLKSINLTTGAAGTAGTLTGNWSMASTSNLTLGTGYIDARTGTLYSDTLNAGASGTAGVITGTWTVAAGSSLTASSVGGQANSATITATSSNTANQIVLRDASGNFSAGSVTVTGLTIGSDSIAEYIADTVGAMVTSNTERGISVTYDDADNTLDFDVGDFTITLTGDVTGTGTVTNLGNVSITTTVSADSTVLGTDTTGQYAQTVAVSGSGLTCTAPNAADGTAYTITSNATNANTGSTIVFRDSSGNFSAGTITAALSGNATTANAWATGRTITLTGDVTGVSAAFDGSGNLSFATTIAANSVALGSDTTGNYVATAGVSGNGLSGSASGETSTFTVTSNATSANTANTIVFRDGSGNFSAGVMTGTATQARYADLAERYASDREYEVGTVVVFGGEREITTSMIKEDTRVAGVISEKPAYLMNHEAGSNETHPAVALVGRVPCKVVGRVCKGDMLVTSGIKGVAVSSNNPRVGSMIGRALEDYDSDHIGVIEIAVGRG